MGVYIKGIEMPKNCYVCPFCDYVSARCDAVNGNPYTPESRYEKRADFCPLVPIQPHGRLGDLDKIERTLHEWESVVWDRNTLKMLRDCINLVKAARTIIPAEEATP